MTCIIRVVGVPEGWRSPHDGRWVVDYDPDTPYGMLTLTTTDNRKEARRFENFMQAITYSRRASESHPTRPDGKPNRPLTGLTLEFEQD